MSLIYFAHPIDYAAADVVRAVVDVRVQLVEAGHTVFDPGEAWRVPDDIDSRLQAVNLKVLAQADVVFAYLPPNVTTIGTVLEMVEASNLGIPVIAVLPKPSVALLTMGDPETVWQFTDARTAVEAIYQIVEDHPRPTFTRITLTAMPGGEIWTDGTLLGEHTDNDWPASDEKEFDELECPSAFAVLGEGARLPERAHDDDAGFDLFYSGSRTITVPAMGTADVPSDVAIEWPPNVWALLIGRSSTFRDRGLLVNPAVIDPGYRGKLFAIVRNIGPNSVKIEPGERIAQLVPLPALAPGIDIEKVEELTPTERGANGLGSSGR